MGGIKGSKQQKRLERRVKGFESTQKKHGGLKKPGSNTK